MLKGVNLSMDANRDYKYALQLNLIVISYLSCKRCTSINDRIIELFKA